MNVLYDKVFKMYDQPKVETHIYIFYRYYYGVELENRQDDDN